MISLPIDAFVGQILASLEEQPNLVLKAAPGTGKTTRVPPALLRSRFLGKSEIIVLEPRRLAAKYSARRVAQEMGEETGQTVGYQFRFERSMSQKTRLKFVTEGMLMRLLVSDPLLKNVGAVFLDEFHERSLHTDTALAYLRFLQQEKRRDLRLIVMSATLDATLISDYLGQCPKIEVENRLHPVTIEYRPSQKRLEEQVRDAVRALPSQKGHTLVFLPGMGEIRRAEAAIGGKVYALHGELSREEQDQALAPSGDPKIILSTNIAETSLTIEGITTVIDSGLHRQATYSWWSGMPALKTKAISRASAIQRTGRAGRTGPGHCVRLYSEAEFNSRPAFETPEIRRADLCQTLLELKTLGIEDFSRFPWFEAPSPTSLDASWQLLYRLGAVNAPQSSAPLTEIGKALTSLPAHPRLGRFLLEAQKLGVSRPAAQLAALIAEGDLETLDVLDGLRAPLTERLRRVQQQLLLENKGSPSKNESESLRRALLTGFPDRVAKKRRAPSASDRAKANEVELVFSSGGSTRIEDQGVIREADFFITIDLLERESGRDVKVRSLSTLNEEWLWELEPTPLAEENRLVWDRQRVFTSSELRYDQLNLSENLKPAEASTAVFRFLIKSALGIDWESARGYTFQAWLPVLSKLGGDPEEFENLLAKMALLEKYFPNDLLPKEQALKALEDSLSMQTQLAELKETDWGVEFLQAYAPNLAPRIESLLPSTLTLPSGRRAKIRYSFDKSPWTESRLQDFFGMKTAPSLLGGRLPLTLHLLAPNQRAVQVTQDLAGFWEREYPTLRKALSRRYPRHAWPENP